MSEIKDTSGPAFPRTKIVNDFPRGSWEGPIDYGITKREYYAAMAMMGMMSRDIYDEGQNTPAKRSRLAYIEADSMLKEGSK